MCLVTVAGPFWTSSRSLVTVVSVETTSNPFDFRSSFLFPLAPVVLSRILFQYQQKAKMKLLRSVGWRRVVSPRRICISTLPERSLRHSTGTFVANEQGRTSSYSVPILLGGAGASFVMVPTTIGHAMSTALESRSAHEQKRPSEEGTMSLSYHHSTKHFSPGPLLHA